MTGLDQKTKSQARALQGLQILVFPLGLSCRTGGSVVSEGLCKVALSTKKLTAVSNRSHMRLLRSPAAADTLIACEGGPLGDVLAHTRPRPSLYRKYPVRRRCQAAV